MYKRTVVLRDMSHNRWTVQFELRVNPIQDHRSRTTLQPLPYKHTLSITGNGSVSCGQCNTLISPRTLGQQQLLDFWDKYHLNHMSAGTVKQDRYLKSQEYIDDFNKFVDLFSGFDKQHRMVFDNTNWIILCNIFDIPSEHIDGVREVMVKYMNNNPIAYILGTTSDDLKHQKNDLYVQYLFLAIHGLYNDRGYKYGSSWLYDELPDDIRSQIDSLCSLIEQEEQALTLELNPVFDMGSEDFEADDSIVKQVMELRGCDKHEAMRFIALGMHLQCTFGDLNDTFETVDSSMQLYSANGTEYYLGTEDELTEVADDVVHNDREYEYFWREAVASGRTEESLKDWLDSIVSADGWVSVLNHWNGEYHEYAVGNKSVCVSLS